MYINKKNILFNYLYDFFSPPTLSVQKIKKFFTCYSWIEEYERIYKYVLCIPLVFRHRTSREMATPRRREYLSIGVTMATL